MLRTQQNDGEETMVDIETQPARLVIADWQREIHKLADSGELGMDPAALTELFVGTRTTSAITTPIIAFARGTLMTLFVRSMCVKRSVEGCPEPAEGAEHRVDRIIFTEHRFVRPPGVQKRCTARQMICEQCHSTSPSDILSLTQINTAITAAFVESFADSHPELAARAREIVPKLTKPWIPHKSIAAYLQGVSTERTTPGSGKRTMGPFVVKKTSKCQAPIDSMSLCL